MLSGLIAMLRIHPSSALTFLAGAGDSDVKAPDQRIVAAGADQRLPVACDREIEDRQIVTDVIQSGNLLKYQSSPICTEIGKAVAWETPQPQVLRVLISDACLVKSEK